MSLISSATRFLCERTAVVRIGLGLQLLHPRVGAEVDDDADHLGLRREAWSAARAIPAAAPAGQPRGVGKDDGAAAGARVIGPQA